jgi:UDP-GlcNAc:undecaprenyl-phosphate GlcNAc-1-phosphate transferase
VAAAPRHASELDRNLFRRNEPLPNVAWVLMDNFLAPFIAFCVTLLTVPLAAKQARRHGLMDYPGGRKAHEDATPLVGGLAIYCGILVATLLTSSLPAVVIVGLAGMAAFLALGLLDDLYDIGGSPKLVLQTAIVTAAVVTSDLHISTFGHVFGAPELVLGPMSVPMTVICVVGVINAVNMSDGVDGLCGGVVLVALLWLCAAAYVNGAMATVSGIGIVSAGVVAFLAFNFRVTATRKAKIFLGDAGSLMLGFAIAWFSVRVGEGLNNQIPPITIAWILALPVIDTLSLMARRMTKGRSPLHPDREHLHHILLRAGFSQRQTTNILVLAGFLFGAVGVVGASLNVPEAVLWAGFVPLVALHYYFVRHAWKTMKAVRRLRALAKRRSGDTPV